MDHWGIWDWTKFICCNRPIDSSEASLKGNRIYGELYDRNGDNLNLKEPYICELYEREPQLREYQYHQNRPFQSNSLYSLLKKNELNHGVINCNPFKSGSESSSENERKDCEKLRDRAAVAMDGIRNKLVRHKSQLTNGHGGNLKSPMVKRCDEFQVALRGWLFRLEGAALKQWKRRWFVLGDYCLFYYKDTMEEKLLGSVLLPSYRVSPCVASEDGITRKFSFKLEHQNMKSYFLAADSKESMNQWMNALSLASIMQLNYSNLNGTLNGRVCEKERNRILSNENEIRRIRMEIEKIDNEKRRDEEVFETYRPYRPIGDVECLRRGINTSICSPIVPINQSMKVLTPMVQNNTINSGDKYPGSYNCVGLPPISYPGHYFIDSQQLLPHQKRSHYANAPPKPRRQLEGNFEDDYHLHNSYILPSSAQYSHGFSNGPAPDLIAHGKHDDMIPKNNESLTNNIYRNNYIQQTNPVTPVTLSPESNQHYSMPPPKFNYTREQKDFVNQSFDTNVLRSRLPPRPHSADFLEREQDIEEEIMHIDNKCQEASNNENIDPYFRDDRVVPIRPKSSMERYTSDAFDKNSYYYKLEPYDPNNACGYVTSPPHRPWSDYLRQQSDREQYNNKNNYIIEKEKNDNYSLATNDPNNAKEESLQRLLEWKQRLLTSPLNKRNSSIKYNHTSSQTFTSPPTSSALPIKTDLPSRPPLPEEFRNKINPKRNTEFFTRERSRSFGSSLPLNEISYSSDDEGLKIGISKHSKLPRSVSPDYINIGFFKPQESNSQFEILHGARSGGDGQEAECNDKNEVFTSDWNEVGLPKPSDMMLALCASRQGIMHTTFASKLPIKNSLENEMPQFHYYPDQNHIYHKETYNNIPLISESSNYLLSNISDRQQIFENSCSSDKIGTKVLFCDNSEIRSSKILPSSSALNNMQKDKSDSSSEHRLDENFKNDKDESSDDRNILVSPKEEYDLGDEADDEMSKCDSFQQSYIVQNDFTSENKLNTSKMDSNNSLLCNQADKSKKSFKPYVKFNTEINKVCEKLSIENTCKEDKAPYYYSDICKEVEKADSNDHSPECENDKDKSMNMQIFGKSCNSHSEEIMNDKKEFDALKDHISQDNGNKIGFNKSNRFFVKSRSRSLEYLFYDHLYENLSDIRFIGQEKIYGSQNGSIFDQRIKKRKSLKLRKSEEDLKNVSDSETNNKHPPPLPPLPKGYNQYKSGKELKTQKKLSRSVGAGLESEQLGLRLCASAGNLSDKSHEELILLLIQLRRNQSNLMNTCDSLRVQMESEEKLIEIEPQRSSEHRAKYEDLKSRLMEAERTYNSQFPLIEMVNNMVKFGHTPSNSAKKFYASNSNFLIKDLSSSKINKLDEQESKFNYDINQKINEQTFNIENMQDNFLKTNDEKVSLKFSERIRCTDYESELVSSQNKGNNAYDEHESLVRILKQDKNILEDTLKGIKSSLSNMDYSGTVTAETSIENMKKQQTILENELNRIRGLLLQSEKGIEQRTAESSKAEKDVQKSKSCLESRVVKNENNELAEELANIDQAIEGLHAKRKELLKSLGVSRPIETHSSSATDVSEKKLENNVDIDYLNCEGLSLYSFPEASTDFSQKASNKIYDTFNIEKEDKLAKSDEFKSNPFCENSNNSFDENSYSNEQSVVNRSNREFIENESKELSNNRNKANERKYVNFVENLSTLTLDDKTSSNEEDKSQIWLHNSKYGTSDIENQSNVEKCPTQDNEFRFGADNGQWDDKTNATKLTDLSPIYSCSAHWFKNDTTKAINIKKSLSEQNMQVEKHNYPKKIDIPQRYIPEEKIELSAEEQERRFKKAENFNRILCDSYTDYEFRQPTATSSLTLSSDEQVDDLPSLRKISSSGDVEGLNRNNSNGLSQFSEEKKRRARLLKLNFEIAKEVTEKSRLIAILANSYEGKNVSQNIMRTNDIGRSSSKLVQIGEMF